MNTESAVIRLPKELKNLLLKLAEEEGLSLSSFIRKTLIKEYGNK
jgi:predicted DNA-binding protein